jgi:hypothetical protein
MKYIYADQKVCVGNYMTSVYLEICPSNALRTLSMKCMEKGNVGSRVWLIL